MHSLRNAIVHTAALTAMLGSTLAAAAPAPAPSRVVTSPDGVRFRVLRTVRLPATSPARDIYYYQTQYYGSVYQSLAPIWRHGNPATGLPYVTDVMIAAFHLGYNSDGSPYIHLNDNPPSDPMFDVMWPEVKKLQRLGVTARMMLGGAAKGSYADLFANWKTFYPVLRKTLRQYRLNGIDLDVEETVSLADIEKLIRRLAADFGPSFLITLSPVCSALWGGANLSGFSYIDLYQSSVGGDIAWFNAQFYSGFGNMASTTDYDKVLSGGVFTADKVVAGTISNPQDGSGFVPIATVATTVKALVAEHGTFGGVAAWEYFNALPGGQADPAKWAKVMAGAMQ
jgi:hypothetical protein